MNLDELRSVQSKERKKDSLQNLRPSFYQEVGDYIADLEDERDRVADQVDDPFASPEVSQLTDEVETAKDVVEAVYERRMGKLVKQASLAAAGMAADDEGLTAEEQELFADLVDRIGSNKSHVLDVLEGNVDGVDVVDPGPNPDEPAPRESTVGEQSRSEPTPADGAESTADRQPASDGDTPPAPPESEPDPASPEPDTAPDDSSGLSPADAMGAGASGSEESADTGPSAQSSDGGDRSPADAPPEPAVGTTDDESDTPIAESVDGESDTPGAESVDGESDSIDTESVDVDRVTVKITQDLGSILGVDAREYTLATDDVVTLPEENATPLLEREAAERLE